MRRKWEGDSESSADELFGETESVEDKLIRERREKRLRLQEALAQKADKDQPAASAAPQEEDRTPSPKGSPMLEPTIVNTVRAKDGEDRGMLRQLLQLREEQMGRRGLTGEEMADDGDAGHGATLDMFSGSPIETTKGAGIVKRAKVAVENADAPTDQEGYYNLQVGELLDSGKYRMTSAAGKGVFSTVVRAKLTVDDSDVAIKLIRNNEVMMKAGQKEIAILKMLNEADPEDTKHVVRMRGSFTHRGHLGIVFESLDINLREVLRKYGAGKGISMEGVRLYAKHLLLSLHLLSRCNLVHADLKPDNILATKDRTSIKLCDFGSATFVEEDCELTPYLVSRFYRAPEVILGLPYGTAVDMWSLGCCLYELYTGKIAFPGKHNNAMLKLFQDMKGPIPSKMVRKATLGHKHFEGDKFLQIDVDPVSRLEVVRKVTVPDKPKVVLRDVVLRAAESSERRSAALLADLLDKMFALDPSRRLSVKDALKHAFFQNT